MEFLVTYKDDNGEDVSVILTGPEGATVERATKVLTLAASYYSVDPSTISVKVAERRRSKGFLHPVMVIDPQGIERRVEDWYL